MPCERIESNIYILTENVLSGSFTISAYKSNRSFSESDNDGLSSLMISNADKQYLLSRLTKYAKKTFLLIAEDKPALALLSLYPSTGCIMLMTVDMPISTVVNMNSQGALWDLDVCPSVLARSEPVRKIKPAETASFMQFAGFIDKISACCYLSDRSKACPVVFALFGLAETVSENIGCHLTYNYNMPIGSLHNYDGYIASVLLIISLLFVRNNSDDRSCCISSCMTANGLILSVSAQCRLSSSKPKTESFKRLFEKFASFCIVSERNGTVYIGINPQHSEISLLGVKDHLPELTNRSSPSEEGSS